jgi:hypothetical protein
VAAAVAVAGCAVLALTACGSERAGTSALPATGAVSASAATGTSSADAVAAHASVPIGPAKRAAEDAAATLAAFRPPPGAMRTGPLKVASLAQVSAPMTPDLVTRTQWYRVTGQPLTVLSWITTHCPAGMTLAGSTGVGWMPVRCGSASQSKPPGLISPGAHVVPVWSDMLSNATGELVVWVPAKLAAERIPATAKVVTIVHVPGSAPQPAGDTPVTITDPATVAAIVAVVNRLSVYPPGVRFCPLDIGSAMQLTFRAALSGPALAVVTADSGGCGTVAVTIDGKAMPTLGDAPSMQHQVATIARLPWPADQVPDPRPTTT